MRRLMTATLALAAAILAALPAAAEDGAAGRWVVTGKVAGFGFTLNCRFDQAGPKLTGVCVDGATSDARVKGGKRHDLTRGQVTGDQVSFSYESSFLLNHFNVDYTGVRQGDHLSGRILANGQTGAFTAERSGS